MTTQSDFVTVDGLMAGAFDRPREPRSAAYKAGVRDLLTRRINCLTPPWSLDFVPYPMGTAEADAFLAGNDEGKQIWRRMLEQAQIA